MSYNSVCLLQEFFQVLNSEYVRLDRVSIVASQGFVEDGNKVHSVGGINIGIEDNPQHGNNPGFTGSANGS